MDVGIVTEMFAKFKNAPLDKIADVGALKSEDSMLIIFICVINFEVTQHTLTLQINRRTDRQTILT